MSKRSPLLPIFLIVLVDILGFTIVIPLLALYAKKFGASSFTALALVSVYALCSLISAPVLGRLSDRFGRRPLLIISQIGTCAGFLLLAVSSSLWMVFVGRILDGATAGNLSLAQAYISDHTRPENRAKAFGVIGIAFGLGFFIGPIMAGQLSRLGLHAPFVAAAGLSALSILATVTLLPREPGRGAVPPIPVAGADDGGPPPPAGRRPGLFDLGVYADYLRRPGLASLYLQFFLFSFAFTGFTSGFALFATERFVREGVPWGSTEIAWIFAYSGFLGIILQGGLIGRLVKRFGEHALIVGGFLMAAVAYAILGAAFTVAVLLVAATISTLGNGVLRPCLTSQITQAVGPHEQGVALGVSQSLGAIAMVLAPLVGGALLDRDYLLAWALVSSMVAALGLLAAMTKRAPTPVRPGPVDPP